MLSFEDYCAAPGLNWSRLKAMDKSPLHFRHAIANPTEDTTRLMLGRAAHTAVFEADLFPVLYTVFPGAARRGKAWDEFSEANADKSILKADEYENCLRVRDAVHTYAPARDLLAHGIAESCLFWTDPATGIECKARPDFLDGAILVDLKTTGTVDAREFGRTAGRLLYHGQMSFYSRGVATTTDLEVDASIIAVELDAPHDVAVFDLDADARLAGDALVDRLLGEVMRCTAADRWPGRYAEPMPLELPAYLIDNGDDFGITIGGEAP